MKFPKIALLFLNLLCAASIQTLFAVDKQENETPPCYKTSTEAMIPVSQEDIFVPTKINKNDLKIPEIRKELWFKVFDNLSPKDILALRCSSQHMKKFVADYLNDCIKRLDSCLENKDSKDFPEKIQKSNCLRFHDLSVVSPEKPHEEGALFQQQLYRLTTVKVEKMSYQDAFKELSTYYDRLEMPTERVYSFKQEKYVDKPIKKDYALFGPTPERIHSYQNEKYMNALKGKQSPLMTSLKLKNIGYDEKSMPVFCNLLKDGFFPNLISLTFDKKWGGFDPENIGSLNEVFQQGYLKNIISLNFNNDFMSYESMNILSTAIQQGYLPNLRVLGLEQLISFFESSNPEKFSLFLNLIKGGYLKKITSLNLSNNHLDGYQSYKFYESVRGGNLAELASLNLKGSHLDLDAVTSLLEERELPNIRYLHMRIDCASKVISLKKVQAMYPQILRDFEKENSDLFCACSCLCCLK